jgi:pre-mRNA-splicing factor CWC22
MAESEGKKDDMKWAEGRTGGVYVPPFKLKRLMALSEDKSSAEFQRASWEALKKSINGLINKVNVANIRNIVEELFQENLVRGRGLLARSCMKAQMASPGFSNVYAALIAVMNTKLPENGETILKRVILQFRRSYKRNDKPVCLAMAKFIAHLINQKVPPPLHPPNPLPHPPPRLRTSCSALSSSPSSSTSPPTTPSSWP